MEQLSWVMPLLLIPGVGLLINSTSVRYANIHTEVHHWVDHGTSATHAFLQNLRTRALLFRDALMALYLSVSLLAMGSVFGAIIDMVTDGWDQTIVIGFSFFGICSLVYASILLVRESHISLAVFDEHFMMIHEAEEN